MKKNLLVMFLVCVATINFGQTNSIPNGNMEQWTTSSCEIPANYTESSNEQNFFRHGLPCNVKKTTDAYHGTYAVEVSTNASATDTAFGYFINGNTNQDPAQWTGGMSYNKKPVGIRGYFKYNVATADSATIIIAFSKAGVNIGTYVVAIGGIHNTYTLFDHTFSPALAVTPDSVIFGAISCKLSGQGEPSGLAGSVLKLDSISFTGVNGQPALLNGDFETWQTETFNSPDLWISGSDSGEGVERTTDAKGGSSAIELITTLSERNNIPRAQPSELSTGWYLDNCNNSCTQQGGYPFSNQVDTLGFWYKYAPAGSCNAEVRLIFKKNGTILQDESVLLTAATAYQYMEMPIAINGQAPDTVIINIQSSAWDDTLITYVGTKLTIDEIYFKSQSFNTSIADHMNENAITIFPNPSNGKIYIQGLPEGVHSLEVYNSIGERVVVFTAAEQQISNEIDLSASPAGIYFVKINIGQKMYSKKVAIE